MHCAVSNIYAIFLSAVKMPNAFSTAFQYISFLMCCYKIKFTLIIFVIDILSRDDIFSFSYEMSPFQIRRLG